jgi:hypothetical protein
LPRIGCRCNTFSCHVMIVIKIEVIAINDWYYNITYCHERWSLQKMLRQRCLAWKKPSIATILVVANPIFWKHFLHCNNQTFATTPKKCCELYCYLTTCYTSKPTSNCCNNGLLHLFWAYCNDSMLKQKGKNLVMTSPTRRHLARDEAPTSSAGGAPNCCRNWWNRIFWFPKPDSLISAALRNGF